MEITKGVERAFELSEKEMVKNVLSLELARSGQSTYKTCKLKVAEGDPRVGIQREDERRRRYPIRSSYPLLAVSI